MITILVPVQRILDPQEDVRLTSEYMVETVGRKTVMNPFDETALEAAVSLREKGLADQVIAIAYGNTQCQDILRRALAAQANRAVWVQTNTAPTDWALAECLAAFAQRENIDLILCGKQSADEDACQLAQLTAGLLDWPQIISAIELSIQSKTVTARCDSLNTDRQITLSLPAVIGVDLMLCNPRFIGLAHILKAKKAPIEVLTENDLNLSSASLPVTTTIRNEYPAAHGECRPLSSVEELIQLIKTNIRK